MNEQDSSVRVTGIGASAGGIAHDFNNILNIIQGYASVLGEPAESEQIAESREAILETTQRGAALVKQLLTLAQKTDVKLESVDANKLIRDLKSMITRTFPKNIEVIVDPAPELPSMPADVNAVMQAMLNLCLNARDAMPGGGILALKTYLVQGKSLAEEGNEAKAERYICIEVGDTGTGIDEHIQSRIFEPFFTTKGTGQGTGLGLTVVYGFVKNHDGFIQVKSRSGEGTTFRVCLPAPGSGEQSRSSWGNQCRQKSQETEPGKPSWSLKTNYSCSVFSSRS